jgi:hypothetical protein
MSHVSAVLKRSAPRREFFDPKNKTHVESLKIFLSTGKWGSVQFECEPPFISVPEYVFRKYLCHKLGVKDVSSFVPPEMNKLLEANSAIAQIQTAP